MERWKEKGKTILISSLAWGVCAHGMTMFNKFSSFDDVESLFGAGTTFSLGRWMLSIVNVCSKKLYGSSQYSVPVYNVLLSILFLAGMSMVIADLLGIQKKSSLVALSGILVVFPVITGIFGYMFTAPFYAFGMLLTAIGVWLLYRKPSWYMCLIGIGVLACAVGIYQANIAVAVILMLLYMLKLVQDVEQNTIRKVNIMGGMTVGAALGFFVGYLVINKVFLTLVGGSLSGYKGISNFGLTSPVGYLQRIGTAYIEFFAPTRMVARNMYPFSIAFFYRVMLICIFVIAIMKAVAIWKKSKIHGAYWMIFVALLPLAANFVYVMCDTEAVTGLMMYAEAFLVVGLIWLLEQELGEQKAILIGKKCAYILVLLICILYVRFDNICYMKAEFVQEQTLSYYERLVGRIQSIEGYDDSLPVAYVGESSKSGEQFTTIPEFEAICLNPYMDSDSMINNYAWKTSMKMWLGFDPQLVDAGEFCKRDDVKKMTCYPSDGSIKMIDGVIVVKFADE